LESRNSVKRGYIKGCPGNEVCWPARSGVARSVRDYVRAPTKNIRVSEYGFLQLQHFRRTFPSRDPQEEARGLCLPSVWHGSRSGALCDRGITGGFAEWRLPAG